MTCRSFCRLMPPGWSWHPRSPSKSPVAPVEDPGRRPGVWPEPRVRRETAAWIALPDEALNLKYSFSCSVRVYGGRFGAMTASQSPPAAEELRGAGLRVDRKSTRLNSSHL